MMPRQVVARASSWQHYNNSYFRLSIESRSYHNGKVIADKTFHRVAFPLSIYIGYHGGPETVKLLLAWQLLVALMSCHVVERQNRV
jgi:hypothetical protein